MMIIDEYAMKNGKYNDELLVAYELYCLRCLLEDMMYDGVNIKTGGDNYLRVMR